MIDKLKEEIDREFIKGRNIADINFENEFNIEILNEMTYLD